MLDYRNYSSTMPVVSHHSSLQVWGTDRLHVVDSTRSNLLLNEHRTDNLDVLYISDFVVWERLT